MFQDTGLYTFVECKLGCWGILGYSGIRVGNWEEHQRILFDKCNRLRFHYVHCILNRAHRVMVSKGQLALVVDVDVYCIV